MSHHTGELAVQRRAGVTRDDWGSAGVDAEIPPIAADFLRRQRMVVVGAADSSGAVWAGILTGPAGFATAGGARTITLLSRPRPGDPLAAPLAAKCDLGMLAIEPQTRRRLRINGRSHPEGRLLVVETDQVYSNCPKYIQTRELGPDDPLSLPGSPLITRELTERQQRWIAEADTFFVATYAAGHGADASSRGGAPGFVQVLGPRRLRWPDYKGNAMYMTLGNLELNAACSLLFLDWAHGHTLQLTGRARVDWDPGHAAAIPAAQRIVEFNIDRAVQVSHASPLRWVFGEYFRHNPPVVSSPNGPGPQA